VQLTSLPLKDSFLIELKPHGDDRGFFARLFCKEVFAELGLDPHITQINNSFSAPKGTLRGLHYQLAPYAETKIVRCIQGSFYDVIVDLRPDSPTYKQSYGAVLSAANRRMMYVPKGFAHGFLTLEENSEVIYFVTQAYNKEHERGIRWDDPFFNIEWPESPQIISERDRQHPDFTESY